MIQKSSLERPLYAAHTGEGPLPQVMLPNSNHSPLFCTKNAIHASVASPIRIQFDRPKLRIGFWYRAVNRAHMPKTSINKDCHTRNSKDKVRSALQWNMSSPTIDPAFPKYSDSQKFCRFIATPANKRHDFSPLGFRVNVSH